jgi:hypothetical protein
VDQKTNQSVPVGGNTGPVSSIVALGDEIWLKSAGNSLGTF